MNPFHYVYVLRSSKDGNFYVGYSSDLKRRINQHESGKVPSTADRRPLELVYYEACRTQADATKPANYLTGETCTSGCSRTREKARTTTPPSASSCARENTRQLRNIPCSPRTS